MKALAFTCSILTSIIILIYFFGTSGNSFAFRLASKIIGHPAEDGDGAFQYPLAWIILILIGILVGFLIGLLINKYFKIGS